MWTALHGRHARQLALLLIGLVLVLANVLHASGDAGPTMPQGWRAHSTAVMRGDGVHTLLRRFDGNPLPAETVPVYDKDTIIPIPQVEEPPTNPAEEPTTTTTEEPTTTTTTTEEPTTTTTTKKPTTTTTTEEPTTTTTTKEPTTTTTTEEPTTTTTTKEPTTTTTTTEEPTTTTTTKEPTTTTTTEEPTTTTTTKEPTTTTTTEEPTTTTTTKEPTTTTTALPATTTTADPSTNATVTTAPPTSSSKGSGEFPMWAIGVSAGGVVVCTAVVVLIVCWCRRRQCKCGGAQRPTDESISAADDELMLFSAAGPPHAGDGSVPNPLASFSLSSLLFSPPAPASPPRGDAPQRPDHLVMADALRSVADLPRAAVVAAGDPQHVNRSSNQPYVKDGVVPWTGRPPTLRGPQPPCVVPIRRPDGSDVPFAEVVMPGPGLEQTPTIMVPVDSHAVAGPDLVAPWYHALVDFQPVETPNISLEDGDDAESNSRCGDQDVHSAGRVAFALPPSPQKNVRAVNHAPPPPQVPHDVPAQPCQPRLSLGELSRLPQQDAPAAEADDTSSPVSMGSQMSNWSRGATHGNVMKPVTGPASQPIRKSPGTAYERNTTQTEDDLSSTSVRVDPELWGDF